MRKGGGRRGGLDDEALEAAEANNRLQNDRALAEDDGMDLMPEERSKRDGTGETRCTLSWIWFDNSVPLDGGDGGRQDDVLRVEWSKSRSRANRATEEVLLLREEMRRTLLSLTAKAKSWRDRIGERVDVGEDLQEGLRAYALEQASLQDKLVLYFREQWKAPLGAAMAENDANEGDDDEESGDERDEEGNDNARADLEDGDDDGDDGWEQEKDDDVAPLDNHLLAPSMFPSASVLTGMVIDE